MKITRLDAAHPDFEARFSQLIAYENTLDAELELRVSEIIADVKRRGDEALLEYSARFDRVHATSMSMLEIPQADLHQRLNQISQSKRNALQQAAARIRAYHEHQPIASWQYEEADGSRLGQRVTPLDRVGVYVPGGKAAYPSTVLMNAIPARVAGVPEIIMVVPTPAGERNDLVLAAAAIAGVDRVFALGGAQAVAALAFGTDTVPAVDKIVGPGNAYVAAAKRQVFGVVGIDMVAGPSEILVICDGAAPADWIAMDLFSQAEHDEMAQAILLSPDAQFLDEVETSMLRQLESMPRANVIRESIERRGALIKVHDLDQACEIASRVAPEHLELSVENPDQWVEKIRHAGAIFMGRYSSEALGDYCAGPNHVLPTARTARFSSPLGVYDFQKRTSLIHVSRAGANTLGVLAGELADGEGLPAHAASARYRLHA